MTLAPETLGGSGDQGSESPEVEQIPSTTTEDSGDGVDVDDGEDNVEWTRNVHSALPPREREKSDSSSCEKQVRVDSKSI